MSNNNENNRWLNIDLDSSDSELNLIENLTFKDLLLNISCNIPEITLETVTEQFNKDIEYIVRDAKEVFEANKKEILRKAIATRNSK